MIAYFVNIYKISKALLSGMGVTLKWMFQPSVTVQFPHEKLTPPERFRGTLVFDTDTCTACNLCVKACPTACISLDPYVEPATKKRLARITWYQIDFGKCNYCRLCEEACPTKPIKSVRHSHGYEWSMTDRKDMFVKWTRPAPETPPPAAAGTPAAGPVPTPTSPAPATQ